MFQSRRDDRLHVDVVNLDWLLGYVLYYCDFGARIFIEMPNIVYAAFCYSDFTRTPRSGKGGRGLIPRSRLGHSCWNVTLSMSVKLLRLFSSYAYF